MVTSKAIRRRVAPGELPDFTPVPRQCPRHDGWTPARQRAFVEALADTGCVAIAARMVNMSQSSVYQLRRQPGAAGFRAAMDAAQTLGLQPVRDEAFHRAMVGQLVPVFVGGRLMGFRRKKNDRLLMFILRNYGFGPGGTRTTINYVSSRAGAATLPPPAGGMAGERGSPEPGAAAEASTATVKTIISAGGNAPGQAAADDMAASIVNAFAGVALDAAAQAEIYRALEACAERSRALENDPENDPERIFASPEEARGGVYLGELELGDEADWVAYKPDGEHGWESLGEGGAAAEADKVLAEMAARKALLSPEQQAAEHAAIDARIRREFAAQQRLPEPVLSDAEGPEPDPDDPRFDWRNWTDEGYVPPQDPPPDFRGRGTAGTAVEGPPSEPAPAKATGKRSPEPGRSPRKPYKKRTPKPPFTPPDEDRKVQAVAEVAAARRDHAAAEAARRKRDVET